MSFPPPYNPFRPVRPPPAPPTPLSLSNNVGYSTHKHPAIATGNLLSPTPTTTATTATTATITSTTARQQPAPTINASIRMATPVPAPITPTVMDPNIPKASLISANPQLVGGVEAGGRRGGPQFITAVSTPIAGDPLRKRYTLSAMSDVNTNDEEHVDEKQKPSANGAKETWTTTTPTIPATGNTTSHGASAATLSGSAVVQPQTSTPSPRLELLCTDHPKLALQSNKEIIQIDIPVRMPHSPAFRMIPVPRPVLVGALGNDQPCDSSQGNEWSNGPYTQPVSYFFVFMIQCGAAHLTSLVLANGGTGRVRIYGASMEQAAEFMTRTASPAVAGSSGTTVDETDRCCFFDDEPLDRPHKTSVESSMDPWHRRTVGDLVHAWTVIVPDTTLIPTVLTASNGPPASAKRRIITWPVRAPQLAASLPISLVAVECMPLVDDPDSLYLKNTTASAASAAAGAPTASDNTLPPATVAHVGLQWLAIYGIPIV